ncbi:MAG TPA: hypothetical protein VJB59_03295 [Bdellovibrionota bacterium]|nr:hypothetical protein [Bdellovibrionota bacterium]
MSHPNPLPPVTIEFIKGSRIHPASSAAPADEVTTWIEFSDGHRISIPTDQIILGEETNGAARIGLGGMSFEGLENERLVFWRVKDLLPDELLPAQRELKVTLDKGMVSRVLLHGTKVWPRQRKAKTK